MNYDRKMNTAFVHDWLPVISGAEHVLSSMLRAVGPSDVYTLFDFLRASDRQALGASKIFTSELNALPMVERYYRWLFPFCPLAIENFDLSDYDLVVSSSAAFAKGVIVHPHQRHIAYIHTPVRYAWDQTFEYMRSTKRARGILGWALRQRLHELRKWDVRTAQGPDLFLVNSNVVKRRVEQTYGRKSIVLPPPVAIDEFQLCEQKEDYFVVASRLVPYKRIDLVIEAFREMPDTRLLVLGDGPDAAKLKTRATSNISFLGYETRKRTIEIIQRAKAFVFGGYEDFGIVLAEAQAAGTPVIAYARGGAADIVSPLGEPNPTGVLFEEQTPQSLKDAVRLFMTAPERVSPIDCRARAERFSEPEFRRKFNLAVNYVTSREFTRDNISAIDEMLR